MYKSNAIKRINAIKKNLFCNIVPITPPNEERVPRKRIIKNMACQRAITK
jgi:hypothetical protein